MEHPGVAAISFTGGTMTGKKIATTAAPMFKKLSLELGGKNPNIIFADCDFEKRFRLPSNLHFPIKVKYVCVALAFLLNEVYMKCLLMSL